MELSIIICVYNTKKELLVECLSSIEHSTLDRNREILLIDDGSDIDYRDVCLRYGMKHIKTENLGHLSARLLGISLAMGDFTVFVDSDDTVSHNYHRPMIDAAKRHSADIVINGWSFHTERTKRVCVEDSTMKERICAVGDDALLLYTSSQGKEHSYFVLWNKLFRTSLLKKTSGRLKDLGISDIHMAYSEDALINFFNFASAKKVISINSGFYFYRIHDGQSVAITDKAKLKKQIDSMSFTLRLAEKNIGNNKHFESIKQNIFEWRSLMARTHFSHAKASSAAELYSYIKEKYGVQVNRSSHYSDGSAYMKCELLGDNFGEIDAVLSEIYFCGRKCTATYDRGSKCISRIIADMPHKVTYSEHGEFTVPRRKIPLKNRLIHNPSVYRLGTLIFKKGSRVRAFLKKQL